MDGESALLKAVRRADHKLAAKLLDAGAQVDVPNAFDETPLFVACEKGYDIVSRQLIRAGADICRRTSTGRQWTAFHVAAFSGSVEVLRTLNSALSIANLPECYNFLDADGRNPMHIAAQYGKHTCFDVIAPNAKTWPAFQKGDHQGMSPLHLAARNGHSDAVAVLLRITPHIDPIDRYGRTPFLLAVDLRNAHMAALLASKGASTTVTDGSGATALHMVAKAADKKLMKHVLALCPASVNALDGSGSTPAMLLVRTAVVRVEQLIEEEDCAEREARATSWHLCAPSLKRDAAENDGVAGAVPKPGSGVSSPYREDDATWFIGAAPQCALRYKASCAIDQQYDSYVEGVASCLRLLHEAGCDFNQCDRDGMSPLYLASDTQLPLPIIEALLTGASPEGPPAPDGSSALFIAIERGNLILAERLIKAGAHVDAPRKNGGTALHAAAYLGDEAAVRELVVSWGAAVDACNHGGWTPLFVATSALWLPVVELLLDLDADPHWRDTNGCTALDIALRAQATADPAVESPAVTMLRENLIKTLQSAVAGTRIKSNEARKRRGFCLVM